MAAREGPAGPASQQRRSDGVIDAAQHPRVMDVTGLLRAYVEALVIAERLPPSIAMPRRLPASSLVTVVATRLRPTWGAHRWAVRHIRQNCESLERAIAIRSAAGEGSSEDEAARERVRQFREALPPPMSRLVLLGGFIVGVTLAGALVNAALDAVGDNPDLRGGGRLAVVLDEVAGSPDPSAGAAVLRSLLAANMAELMVFFLAVAWSGYLLVRPFASGYRLAAIAFGRRDGRTPLRRNSPLTRVADEMSIPVRERAAFGDLAANPPRELPFDLAVKALLWVPVLFAALFSVRYTLLDEYYAPSDLQAAAVLLALPAARLLWLGRASARYDGSSRWLVLTVTLVLAVGLLASLPPGDEHGAPALPRDRELSFELSLHESLERADLRGRDLTSIYLPGKDLRGAELSLARLIDADLSEARLEGAQLIESSLEEANLTRADLRGADLSGATLVDARMARADLRRARLLDAKLSGTELQGADLRGADFRGAQFAYVAFDRAIYDRRTVWPKGFDPRRAGAVERR